MCCVSVDLQSRWEDVDMFNIKACELYHNHCLWRDETVINNWFMIIIHIDMILQLLPLSQALCSIQNSAMKTIFDVEINV